MNISKKLLATTLAFSFLLPATANATGFTETIKETVQTISGKAAKFIDVAGHWAKDAILSAVNKGIVKGYPDGTFKPNANVSRAEFIKMLAAALELPVEAVPAGEKWYVPYTNALIEANIHREKDFSEQWDQKMTRLEMSRLAVRAVTPELQQPNMMMDDKAFMYNATKLGIINGLEKGDLEVDKYTTRAQAVAVIERILAIKSGKTLPFDMRAASYAEVAMHGTNIETMWGVKLKPLPFTLEDTLGDDFEVKIEQVLISDMSDKDTPYYDRYPLTRFYLSDGGKSLKDYYVVSMKVKVNNQKEKATGIWVFSSVFGTPGVLKEVGVKMPLSQIDTFPFKEDPIVHLKNKGVYEGWYSYAIKKTNFEADPRYKAIGLFNTMTVRTNWLTVDRY